MHVYRGLPPPSPQGLEFNRHKICSCYTRAGEDTQIIVYERKRVTFPSASHHLRQDYIPVPKQLMGSDLLQGSLYSPKPEENKKTLDDVNLFSF